MNPSLIGLTAILFYASGVLYQIFSANKKIIDQAYIAFLILTAALISHGVFAYYKVVDQNGLHLSFFNSALLVTWLTAASILFLRIKEPVRFLVMPISIIAICSIICVLLSDTPGEGISYEHSGLISHIVLSVIAFGFFTLATLQALLLHRKHKRLKKHQKEVTKSKLPSLQKMETILFELLWSGVITLSLGLLTGFLFIDNIFEQHLAHKTFFSIIAWLTFVTLLAGRWIKGWRGLTACRWTLWGFSLLTTGYFGSKLVIEFLLSNS